MLFLSIVTLFILIIILFIRQNQMKKEIEKQKEIIIKLSEQLVPVVHKVVKKTGEELKTKDSAITQEESQVIKCVPWEVPETISDTDEEYESHKPLFQSENWVGINLLNRLGALLIVIGAIATASYDGFPTGIRSIILFTFAFGVMLVGEIMNRKNPTTASMGVSSAGVALIYVAIATSYFGLETMDMYTALISCIMATILGVFFSTRYEAEVIGCFALIGGYLPIFALDPLNKPMLIGLIVYFILLSLFSLMLSIGRKWSVMNIIGFALTVMGTSYLGWQAEAITALVYACFAFLLYTALPLIATYRTREKFSELDVTLVTLNTFIGSIVIFFIAYRLNIEHLHAYLCIIFAIIYIGLSGWIKYKFKQKNMQTIFLLTSIAFCVLFVPFYFHKEWFTIAWLVEAVVLACYGVLCDKKVAEYSGISILGISAIALLYNLMSWSQFTFKYIFFTIGLLVVLGCYIVKNRDRSGHEKCYKIITFINLWTFVIYMMLKYIKNYDEIGTLCVMATFVLVFLYEKPKFWADNSTRILSNIMHFVGIFGLWITNFIYSLPLFNEDINNSGLIFNLFATVIALTIIIYFNATEEKKRLMSDYKNITIVNFWLSIIWIVNTLIGDFFGTQILLIIFTFVVAFLITRIPIIHDSGTKIIAIVMHTTGIIWLWFFNSTEYTDVFWLMLLNCIVQTIALVAINEIIKLYNKEGREIQFKIVYLSGYFLLVVTQGMMVQGDVAFNSAIISILYAISSFVWILLGFYLGNKPVRKFGLQLSIASVVKLLIIDTLGLSTEMKIVSYISLGLILMLISFVYQKLSRESDE